MKQTISVLVGGSGFVGISLAKKLLEQGHIARIVSRHPEAPFLNWQHPNLEYFAGEMDDHELLGKALKDAKNVVYLVGLLFEKGKQTFMRAHVKAPKLVAQLSQNTSVQSFTFISAIGADKESQSHYARTKALGEEVVKAEFPDAVIIRPSIIFGKFDNFFNQFNDMAKISPILPLIGGGHTKFQPVWVEDVADAIIQSFEKKDMIYEVGGAEILSFKECLMKLGTHTKRKRSLVNLPFSMAKIQAKLFHLLPKPPLTEDQLVMLQSDNIVSASAIKEARTIASLGVEKPRDVDDYLSSEIIH